MNARRSRRAGPGDSGPALRLGFGADGHARASSPRWARAHPMNIRASRFSLLALALAGRSPRSSTGPLGSGGRRSNRPQGWPQGCGQGFRQARDGLSENPDRLSRTLCARMRLRARTSRPFSCLLLFGHAKRSRSGSPKGWPKALALRFERQSDEKTPRRVRGSWWARAHPITAARSGRPKGGPKALALRFRRRSEGATTRNRGKRPAHGGPGPTL